MNSIPLVKYGDVNEINTALIAIRKQLQELTQLVNSLNDIEVEPTDMSEYIKKSSLTDSVESGNENPVTSGGVYTAIGNEANARNTAITNAINTLDVSATGGDTSYISAISETNGKISATAKSVTQTYSSTGTTAISGAGVADAIGTLDVTDTAVSGKYVSAVSETNGKIAVTRANLPDTINNAKSLNNSVTCSTAAGTAAKTVSLSGFTLVKGAKLIIYLQNTNTAQSALTLNVNSTGAKTIVWDGSVTSATVYAMTAGYYNCYYDGTYWFMESYYEAHNARVSGRAINADSSGYATTSLKTTVRVTKTCSTAASTVTKIVSVNSYTPGTRDEVLIYFSNANTASNPTLNVNSTGAKPIKVFGISPDNTNKLLKAGTYYCQYDGTNWNCYPYGTTNEISADNMQTVTSDAVYKYAKRDLYVECAFNGTNITVTNNLGRSDLKIEGICLGSNGSTYSYFFQTALNNTETLQSITSYGGRQLQDYDCCMINILKDNYIIASGMIANITSNSMGLIVHC